LFRIITIKRCTEKLTCCYITVVHVGFEIANLSDDVEEEAHRAFEFEHLAVQAEVVFGTFHVGPDFAFEAVGVSKEDLKIHESLVL
jgi:hypothetical protein